MLIKIANKRIFGNFLQNNIGSISPIGALNNTTINPSSSTPNLDPSISRLIWDNPWNSVPSSTYAQVSGGSGYCRLESGGAAIITDSNDPTSPSNVLRTRFNASLNGGTAPVSIEGWETSGYSDAIDYDRVYFMMDLKIGDTFAGFQLHNTLQKMGFFGHGYAPGQGGRNESFLFLNGSGNTTSDPASIVTQVTYRYELQGPSGSTTLVNKNANMNASFATVNTGVYHKIEIELGINTIGNADGILKMWRDGVQIMNHSNIMYRTATFSKKFWWYKWNPTYGGGTGTGNTRSQVDDILIGHTKIYAI